MTQAILERGQQLAGLLLCLSLVACGGGGSGGDGSTGNGSRSFSVDLNAVDLRRSDNNASANVDGLPLGGAEITLQD